MLGILISKNIKTHEKVTRKTESTATESTVTQEEKADDQNDRFNDNASLLFTARKL